MSNKNLEIYRDETEGNDILPSALKKQQVQHLFFCTAIFNKTLETVIDIFKPLVKKMIIGKEICPTTGTPHLQCFFAFKSKKRSIALGKLCPAKWVACTGSEESNDKYCSKDGNVYRFGYPAEIEVIQEADYFPWYENIFEIIKTKPDRRTVYWIWESEGNQGKSALTKLLVLKHGCTPACGGKHGDIINLIYNTNMDECRTIIFDLARGESKKISYTAIEKIKDGLIVNTKFETGWKAFNSPHVFVFSNEEPKLEKLSADKWKIIKV